MTIHQIQLVSNNGNRNRPFKIEWDNDFPPVRVRHMESNTWFVRHPILRRGVHQYYEMDCYTLPDNIKGPDYL